MVCTNCHQPKKKCLPFPEVPGVCKQCVELGTKCIPMDPNRAENIIRKIWELLDARIGQPWTPHPPFVTTASINISVHINPNLSDVNYVNPDVSTPNNFLAATNFSSNSHPTYCLNWIQLLQNSPSILTEEDNKLSIRPQVICIPQNPLPVFVQNFPMQITVIQLEYRTWCCFLKATGSFLFLNAPDSPKVKFKGSLSCSSFCELIDSNEESVDQTLNQSIPWVKHVDFCGFQFCWCEWYDCFGVGPNAAFWQPIVHPQLLKKTIHCQYREDFCQ